MIDDVPLLPGAVVRDASDQRSTSDESVYTAVQSGDTGPFTVQVSGFNGAASPQPYLLRVTVLEPVSLPCAARTIGTAGTEGSLPSSLDPSTRTLFLVNQERLGDLYGATAASDVMSKLDELATYATLPATSSTSAARSSPSTATAAWPRPTTPGTPIRARPRPPTRS